jgi:hypothetical protein
VNRIRIGAFLTVILGGIFAAAGLMDNLRDFGIGLAVAASGGLVYGLVDYIDGWDR